MNLIHLCSEFLECTWVNTCRSVLNFRDVSSFFLSLSSNRVAYSTICFCCSAIFALQLFKSLRISVSWLLYLLMPCLILRIRFRKTIFDCGGDTLDSKRAGSSEQCDEEPSSSPVLPVFPFPTVKGAESRHINGLLTLLVAVTIIALSKVTLHNQKYNFKSSIWLTRERSCKIQKVSTEIRYFR